MGLRVELRMPSLLVTDEESRKEIIPNTATSTPGRYTYLSMHDRAKRPLNRLESGSTSGFEEGLFNSVTTAVSLL